MAHGSVQLGMKVLPILAVYLQAASAGLFPDPDPLPFDHLTKLDPKSFFDQIDANSDRCITKDELSANFVGDMPKNHPAYEILKTLSDGIFDLMDSNGDGCVTLEEFEADLNMSLGKIIGQDLASRSFDHLTEPDPKSLFDLIDADSNGCITRNELLTVVAMGMPKNHPGYEILKLLSNQAIDMTDSNGDGCVSFEEFEEDLNMSLGKIVEQGLASRSGPTSRKEKNLFEQIDADSNGCIHRDELFAVFVNEMPNKPPSYELVELLDAMFDLGDFNGDGCIRDGEFYHNMSLGKLMPSRSGLTSLDPNGRCVISNCHHCNITVKCP